MVPSGVLSVRALRRMTGLSQNEFALKFHLNVSTLRTWEQGVRACPKHVFYMMSRILELEERLCVIDANASNC